MTSLRVFALAATWVAVAATAAVAADSEWPCWLGPNRDGKSPDTGLLKEWPAGGPKLVWKAEGIGLGFSSPVVSGGQVFATGDVGDNLMLFALDMDGKPKWKSAVGPAGRLQHPGARGTPTIDGGYAYVLTGPGLLACIDTKTGQRKWVKEMKAFGGSPPMWGYAESPLILGKGVVVTPGGSNAVVALDKLTGEKIWASSGINAPAHYSSCIAVTQGQTQMIINGSGGGIFAVNAEDGSRLWMNNFCARNVANCPTPAYADGYVFWANGYGKGGICLKLDAAGGKVAATQAWTTPDMDCHHGGYIIDNGYIYGNHKAGWACLDLKTGEKKWSDNGVGKGSLCYADGMLYLFSEGGGQVALATCSPTGLQIKGKVRVAGEAESWAHPIVIGGRLYVRYASNLYCFDVKAKVG